MSSFPLLPSRTDFGPTYQNERPVENPEREIGATIYNSAFWDLAGTCRSSARGWFKFSWDGALVTTDAQGFAWDPNGALADLTVTRVNQGVYSFAFSAQYADDTGTLRSLVINGANCSQINPVVEAGTHTGANGPAVLTDAAQAWVVNEHALRFIYNTTDGCSGVLLSNTANTATPISLVGGTDTDFDTGDAYVIVNPGLVAQVHMTSAIAGTIYFYHYYDGNAPLLLDPTSAIVEIW